MNRRALLRSFLALPVALRFAPAVLGSPILVNVTVRMGTLPTMTFSRMWFTTIDTTGRVFHHRQAQGPG